jgi:hypothetical protein
MFVELKVLAKEIESWRDGIEREVVEETFGGAAKVIKAVLERWLRAHPQVDAGSGIAAWVESGSTSDVASMTVEEWALQWTSADQS